MTIPLTPYELREAQFEIDPLTGRRRMEDPEWRRMWQAEAKRVYTGMDETITGTVRKPSELP